MVNLHTDRHAVRSRDNFENKSQYDSPKINTKRGNIFVVDYLPVSEEIFNHTKMTFGSNFCFAMFDTPQAAQLAKKMNPNFNFFFVNTLDDIDKAFNMKEEYEAPQKKLFCPEFLTAEKARDQLVIRSGHITEVLWNDARHFKPQPVHKIVYWRKSYVKWSPLGTYLVTLHNTGVAIWGGVDTFHRLMRYRHSMVKLVDFSPCEKYLVTYQSQEPSYPTYASEVEIKIFDVRSGRMIKDFEGNADDFSVEGAEASWPLIRWARDKFFAMLSKNTIFVYETETFNLLDDEPMKVDNVVDICWSPTDSIIALLKGGGMQPAKVVLLDILGKVEEKEKNIFNVKDCKMYWQSNGEYLAVQVDSGFELFRIKEKDIPIEVLEVDKKKIIAFAWEPNGHRFAVIHGDQLEPNISFYSMKTPQNPGKVSKLATLEAKQADALFWSPTGKHIVFSGLKCFNGKLEVFNVDKLETMAIAKHFMATDIAWDPTGRYIATAETKDQETENGIHMWSFNGKFLYRIPKDHLFQLAWSPCGK